MLADPLASAVIFDYGGVVRREDPADFDAFAKRFAIPPGALWAAFHQIPEYNASRTGRLGRDAYRLAVARALAPFLPPDDAARALGEWDALCAADAPVEPDMRIVLESLRGRTRLGLLSNAGRGALERLRELGVAALFDDVLCSGDVGLAKPDPAVYLLSANRLGVAPARCLFIDDLEKNVAGARAVGMRAHHHHRSRHAQLLDVLASVGLPIS